MEISGIELEELDIKEIGSWPTLLRGIATGLACVLTLVVGFFLIIQGQLDTLENFKSTKIRERTDFSNKYEKSSNIDAYKKQMIDMKKNYNTLLDQLPSHNNVEGLNKDISELASASGLNVTSFQPQAESDSKQEFYGTRTIKLVLEGTYKNFADFASSISNMERVVTLHGFTITAKKFAELGKEDKEKMKQYRTQYPLDITLDAKTYWYLGEEKKTP